MTNHTGLEGPYPAPLVVPGGTVQPDWVDYNGHMNVAYYLMAFDRAIDAVLEDVLGIGESFVTREGQGPFALQSHIHYLAELLEGDAFSFEVLLIGADAKRSHWMMTMLKETDGSLAATYEVVLLNVDHATRRAAPYPDWAAARLARMVEDHADAPRPPQFGKPIGLGRKG